MRLAGSTVAIVGGGIGGMTAALALARQGAGVSVFEQAPALREVGAGLQITPNGARALEGLGLGGALAQAGLTTQAVVPMDGLGGRRIARFDLSRQGPPYRFLHRADLLDLLASAARAAGATIHLGQRIGEALPEADLVIGADGLHSSLRRNLNGAADPFFTGQVAWRAIVPAPDAPVARIWMLPGRHVVTYPLPGGRLNVVAVQERRDWAAEGWHHPDDPDHLRAAFADAAPALRDVLAQVTTTHLWGLFRHPVAPTWDRDGLVLLGDAAHPTLPFLAQGANLAIEDACVLARILGAGGSTADYTAARRPRVTRAIAAANVNARNYHLRGPARLLAHTGLRLVGRVAPDRFLRRLGWLYDFDPWAD